MRVVRRDPEKGYLDTMLWVPKTRINVEGVKNALTFDMTDNRQSRFLTLYEETPNHLLVPREFWSPEMWNFEVVDCRPTQFTKTDVKSKIVLDAKNPNLTVQRDSVSAMKKAEGGILQLACGLGKTVCFIELIAQEKVPALIVVDNTQLLEQWQGEVLKFLDVPGGVGLIQGPVFDWKKSVVLATYQTLANRAEDFPEEARRWFGLVGWDEAHHMSAPTWARSAHLFYGKRIGLTATPERVDGTHVIYDFHLGKVLYKNLSQELRPEIRFHWTGIELDHSDKSVVEATCDINGELHTSKISGYFGQWRKRLSLISDEVKKYEAEGRKILVLSYSVDELVNLFTLWRGAPSLFTDFAKPTPQDVKETLDPCQLVEADIGRLGKKINNLFAQLRHDRDTNGGRHHAAIYAHIEAVQEQLKRHDVWKKIQSETDRRQLAFVRSSLQTNKSNAGLMIGMIKPKDRMQMLRSKTILFSIMKYGREALDEPAIDTVLVCEPMSQKNGLQQLMGRALRPKAGKKSPLVVFFEDNVGPMIGMCVKLRQHLRNWPIDEGGPLDYELVGHPKKGRNPRWMQQTEV